MPKNNHESKDFKIKTTKRIELLVDNYLTLLEKDKLTAKEENYLKKNEKFILKIINKIFPKEIEIDKQLPVPILDLIREDRNKYK